MEELTIKQQSQVNQFVESVNAGYGFVLTGELNDFGFGINPRACYRNKMVSSIEVGKRVTDS